MAIEGFLTDGLGETRHDSIGQHPTQPSLHPGSESHKCVVPLIADSDHS
jgi:hypothetical protein